MREKFVLFVSVLGVLAATSPARAEQTYSKETQEHLKGALATSFDQTLREAVTFYNQQPRSEDVIPKARYQDGRIELQDSGNTLTIDSADLMDGGGFRVDGQAFRWKNGDTLQSNVQRLQEFLNKNLHPAKASLLRRLPSLFEREARAEEAKSNKIVMKFDDEPIFGTRKLKNFREAWIASVTEANNSNQLEYRFANSGMSIVYYLQRGSYQLRQLNKQVLEDLGNCRNAGAVAKPIPAHVEIMNTAGFIGDHPRSVASNCSELKSFVGLLDVDRGSKNVSADDLCKNLTALEACLKNAPAFSSSRQDKPRKGSEAHSDESPKDGGVDMGADMGR